MQPTKLLRSGLVLLLLTLCGALRAEVRLPHVFGPHMVFQQDKPLVVWGWANPGEKVAVRLDQGHGEAVANEKGEWKVQLPAMKAGGPFTLDIEGANPVHIDDVMVGEVWLCSGQSNMEMGIGAVQNGKEEIAAANFPRIRLFKVPKRLAPQPVEDVEAQWKVCSPATVAEGGWNGFSAAAYFFGRELHQKLGVAIGLIDASWGGTRIEPWTPPAGFAAVPALKQEYERVQLADPGAELHRQRVEAVLTQVEAWMAAARKSMASREPVPALPVYPPELQPPHDPQSPTALYNGMIHPLCPFALRGALWYQGESNLGEGMLYAEHMKALVGGWRELWGEGNFPFYFVQIAPYNYGGNAERMGEFWEAQAAAARTIPQCGMAVITDIGSLKDIHPTNKQEVGRRLALLALARTYGHQDVLCSGPTFKALTHEGDKLRITFDNAGTGLAGRDGKPLSWFEVIDANEGGWVPAEATIDGSSVVLSSREAKHPVAMRFAWSMLAEPNLVNSAGLPAAAFRAGDVPKRDLLVLKVPEAKQYKLIYDLDLAKLGPQFSYDVNNSEKFQGPFDRVAYFLELEPAEGETEYAYVSLDAFTESLAKVGIPTLASGARFQQPVAKMNVYSNVRGIVTGTDLAGGNIEFWPNNYGPANTAKVPNASSQVYDFGDDMSDPADGYGSMQVHNHDAKQTIFAINHWKDGERADLGIGNQKGKENPDWTFAQNAGAYKSKRLRILVRPKASP